MGSQKGLKRALSHLPHVSLAIVDEYNTSKYCSHCVRKGVAGLLPLEDVPGTYWFAYEGANTARRCGHCCHLQRCLEHTP